MLLVPVDQKLIVAGKLYVKDRGYIKVGQSAKIKLANQDQLKFCLLYTSPSPRDLSTSRMPSSA